MTKNQTSFKKGNQYWKLRAKENVGRPSKYKPEFCEQILAMGQEGLSPAQMAYEFDVCQDTLENWASLHADFFEALARAKTAAEAYWTNYGMERLGTNEFQAPTWLKTMQARFRQNWTESKTLALTGANGGAIQMQAVEAAVNDAEQILIDLTSRNGAGTETSGASSDHERSGKEEALRLAHDSEGRSTSAE